MKQKQQPIQARPLPLPRSTPEHTCIKCGGAIEESRPNSTSCRACDTRLKEAIPKREIKYSQKALKYSAHTEDLLGEIAVIRERWELIFPVPPPVDWRFAQWHKFYGFDLIVAGMEQTLKKMSTDAAHKDDPKYEPDPEHPVLKITTDDVTNYYGGCMNGIKKELEARNADKENKSGT